MRARVCLISLSLSLWVSCTMCVIQCIQSHIVCTYIYNIYIFANVNACNMEYSTNGKQSSAHSRIPICPSLARSFDARARPFVVCE